MAAESARDKWPEKMALIALRCIPGEIATEMAGVSDWPAGSGQCGTDVGDERPSHGRHRGSGIYGGHFFTPARRNHL